MTLTLQKPQPLIQLWCKMLPSWNIFFKNCYEKNKLDV
jgi:hypothetical protein